MGPALAAEVTEALPQTLNRDSKVLVYARLKSVRANCAAPEGAQFNLPLYPGLTPRANFNAAAARLDSAT
jgi:hypothetical protein